MNRHCGKCKYFGEETVQVINGKDLHRCHNEKSIFKGCLSSATGCNKFEEELKNEQKGGKE